MFEIWRKRFLLFIFFLLIFRFWECEFKKIYIVENCKVYIGNFKIKVFYIINCLICFRNKFVWFLIFLKLIDLVSRLDWFLWSKYYFEIKLYILID